MTLRRLSPDWRRALEMLADAGVNGITEATMLARGFPRATLAVLVRKGLARARRENVRTGRKAIEVYRLRITEAERRVVRTVGDPR